MLVLGVLPLAAAVGLWLRRRWAWYAAFVVGCGLMIWILVEITIIPYDALQPIFGGVGVLIFIVSLLRPVRRFYGVACPAKPRLTATRPRRGQHRFLQARDEHADAD